jgi:nucleoside triphosphatase
MQHRVGVIALIQNKDDEYLLCKKPKGRGMFPGQWGIPGGGIDKGETMEEALRREVREEVGLEIEQIKPIYFADDIQPKYMDGKKIDDVYMIYLLFRCRAKSNNVVLNHEHEKYEWADKERVKDFDLNSATINTFERIGVLKNKEKIYKEWVKYPLGKIGGGKYCMECGRYNVRNSTCTMIGIKNNKVLMVLRAADPQKGWWAFPGGYLDWNETVEECAAREFKEESGYEVKPSGLLGVYSSPKRDLDGRQNVDHCFYGLVGEKLGKSDDEIEKIKWFDLNKLPKNIAFDHREMIRDYLKGRSRNG